EAERLLREVIDRAGNEQRPRIQADAQRDLARLLMKMERPDEAMEIAREARVIYSDCGAEAEVGKLDDLMENQ
ncbi:MAG: hypothetical protein IIA55_13395, partial [Gemmatimonadetes bacterium]|nr:hypothetical protein [Gemmatimonadota bacterium]